jgi:hypothetical protein
MPYEMTDEVQENINLQKTIEELLDKRGISKEDPKRSKLRMEIEERAGIATAQTLMSALSSEQKVEFLKIITSNDADGEAKVVALVAGIPGLQQAVNSAIQAEITKIMEMPL